MNYSAHLNLLAIIVTDQPQIEQLLLEKSGGTLIDQKVKKSY